MRNFRGSGRDQISLIVFQALRTPAVPAVTADMPVRSSPGR